MSEYTSIGVPPRQRVWHITRHTDHWRVWLAVADMQQPYSQWLGTYLAMYDTGRCTRVTIRVDRGDEVLTVKP